MLRKKVEIPVEHLHERLAYSAETGELRWKRGFRSVQNDARFAEKIVGSVNKKGYTTFSFVYRGQMHTLKAHRVAFAMTYGYWPVEVDHWNKIKSDNRLDNLREATHSQNQHNRTNFGVYKYKTRWRAQIGLDNERLFLGSFITKEDARSAYLAAKQKLHPFSAPQES